MKIQITNRNIIITPPPKRDKKNGIKVWFWKEPKPEDPFLPVATCDLIKGRSKYAIPPKFKYAIKGIEF